MFSQTRLPLRAWSLRELTANCMHRFRAKWREIEEKNSGTDGYKNNNIMLINHFRAKIVYQMLYLLFTQIIVWRTSPIYFLPQNLPWNYFLHNLKWISKFLMTEQFFRYLISNWINKVLYGSNELQRSEVKWWTSVSYEKCFIPFEMMTWNSIRFKTININFFKKSNSCSKIWLKEWKILMENETAKQHNHIGKI